MRMVLAWTILLALVGALPAAASEAAWQALREGGAGALFRHARAPGPGAPQGSPLAAGAAGGRGGGAVAPCPRPGHGRSAGVPARGLRDPAQPFGGGPGAGARHRGA